MKYEQLKLKNQLCFPVYAASRLITREYKPHLDKIGITYPQYLVLMILWEQDGVTVNDISTKLILNTNTTTPLLKRMEKLGLVQRSRSVDDERKVIVNLTTKGKKLQTKASKIPESLINDLINENFSVEKLIRLKDELQLLIEFLREKEK